MDFEEDPNIKHWGNQQQQNQMVTVEKFSIEVLPEKTVSDVVDKYGVSYASLLPKEQELLRNCQHLKLWTELAEAGGVVERFSSRARQIGRAHV